MFYAFAVIFTLFLYLLFSGASGIFQHLLKKRCFDVRFKNKKP